MNNSPTSKCNVALDSCVIISLMGESKNLIEKIKSTFKKDGTKIILYDVVLSEVIRKDSVYKVQNRLSELFDYEIETITITKNDIETAKKLSEVHRISHRGDDMILALSKSRNDILITFDRRLIKVCHFLGVRFFNPHYQDNFSVNLESQGKTISSILTENDPVLKFMETKQLECDLEIQLKKYRYFKRKSMMHFDKIEKILEKIEKVGLKKSFSINRWITN